MHTTNYQSTLIAVAPDTKAATSIVPTKAGTVATTQYEILHAAPYVHTSDDLLFLVYAKRSGLAPTKAARKGFFEKPQACLRSSPLAKTHGFGLHHDATGRVALVPMESAQYAKLSKQAGIKVVPAMRSKRA
jgi:hypothetical protein